jgi:hypothetical protein
VPGVTDYEALTAELRPTAATWDAFVREALVGPWMAAYREQTPWESEVLEIPLGRLTYLFDAAPSTSGAARGDDRVVAVWGLSQSSGGKRDKARQAGFVPVPASWSGAGLDRGHFVAHAAGGGMDMNLFPQAAGLNRGTSAEGRKWKAMERHAVANTGTPLFVRSSYIGPTWVPATIDYGLLVDGHLWCGRFDNSP